MKITRPFYALGTSILFVMLGVYLVSTKATDPGNSYPMMTKVVGIACIAFFGTILAVTFYKLIFRK